MAFKAEDGTGLSDATSLCEVTAADTFWADRGGTDWAGDSAEKQAALVRASDYLRNQSRYCWSGIKKSYAQTMPWPRVGATERDGQTVPENVVPWAVIEACCWLALASLTGTDLQPTLEHGGAVRSVSIAGAVSLTFADGARVDDVYQFVDGLLAPLLTSALPLPEPYMVPTTSPQGYSPGEFDYGQLPEPEAE